MIIWLPLALVTALAMDLWAGLLHGRVWHRVLFPIHRSHHRRRRGRFEANDALSALHAPIAIALILYGCRAAPGALREVAFGVGLGMSFFGLAYFVFHDGVVHGRLPVQRLARFAFVARIIRAHQAHHDGAHGGVPYGFFFGPREIERHLSSRRGSPGRRASPRRR